jgi:hypothetical protein
MTINWQNGNLIPMEWVLFTVEKRKTLTEMPGFFKLGRNRN